MSDPVGPAPARLGGPGYHLVERVRDTLRDHRMLDGVDTVIVALSGGPDSTCLLDVLARLAPALDVTLAVAHVDHGLSKDSESVAARVARDAASAGHDAHVIRLSGLEGPNLHARARALRYGFFDMLARQLGRARIATGHTLDDRVETTLARLVHGAGTEGLAGLPPSEGSRIRPLVGIRRSEARAYCEERSLQFYDDPANADLRFERVAVRRLLVSAVEGRWGDGGVRAIARSAERLREDAAALAALADRVYPEVSDQAEDGIRIAVEALSGMPRALRRRILERAVGRVRDRSGGIDAVLDALERPRAEPGRFAVAGGTGIALGRQHVVVSLSRSENDAGGAGGTGGTGG